MPRKQKAEASIESARGLRISEEIEEIEGLELKPFGPGFDLVALLEIK